MVLLYFDLKDKLLQVLYRAVRNQGREKRASAAVGSLFLLPFLDVTYLTTWVRPPFPQLPCLHSQEPCSPQLNTEPGR